MKDSVKQLAVEIYRATGMWILCVGLMSLGQGCMNTVPSSESRMNHQSMAPMVQSYKLGPNDLLEIEVFDEPDLLTETTVSGHGTIKFPLLGEIRVMGMTVKEVEEELTNRLADGYLKNPKLTVSIKQFRNFFVSGEAKRPGAFAYQEGMTVLKAITLAGGWTDRAIRDEARILRVVNGRQEILTVSMEEPVQPDDIIIVPESFF